MPLADDGRMITDVLQLIRNRWHVRIEVTPRIFGLRANDSRHANPIRVSSGKQRRSGRRAHRAVGSHRREQHAFRRNTVDMWSADIGLVIRRDIAVAVIVREDQQDVRSCRFGSVQHSQRNEKGGEQQERMFHHFISSGERKLISGRFISPHWGIGSVRLTVVPSQTASSVTLS